MLIDKHKKKNTCLTTNKDTATYTVTITSIKRAYVCVSFIKNGSVQRGYISINNLGIIGLKTGELNNHFSIGDNLNAIITEYSKKFANWIMKIV